MTMHEWDGWSENDCRSWLSLIGLFLNGLPTLTTLSIRLKVNADSRTPELMDNVVWRLPFLTTLSLHAPTLPQVVAPLVQSVHLESRSPLTAPAFSLLSSFSLLRQLKAHFRNVYWYDRQASVSAEPFAAALRNCAWPHLVELDLMARSLPNFEDALACSTIQLTKLDCSLERHQTPNLLTVLQGQKALTSVKLSYEEMDVDASALPEQKLESPIDSKRTVPLPNLTSLDTCCADQTLFGSCAFIALETLRLQDPVQLSSLRCVLDACPNLRTLEINAPEHFDIGATCRTHRALRKLILRFWPTTDMNPILNLLLQLPAIQEILIASTDYFASLHAALRAATDEWIAGVVSAVLDGVWPKLRTLCLRGIRRPPKEKALVRKRALLNVHQLLLSTQLERCQIGDVKQCRDGREW